MSYYVDKESMHSGRRTFPPGTLRTLYTDERDCYGVTGPSDPYHAKSALCWPACEFFDGQRWRPLAEWDAWFESTAASASDARYRVI